MDAITTHGKDWLKPAWRRPSLVEPADSLSGLSCLALGRQPRTQTAQELPSWGTRPVHPRVLRYYRQHLALGMLCSPASDTLGQGRSGQPSFPTQGELQG